MYLSKLELDRRWLRNPYQVHRLLWNAFPGIPDARRPFLFRVESSRGPGRIPVLMQSFVEPVQPSGEPVVLLAVKSFEPSFAEGRTLRFALCANPVKRLNQERCRVPLIRDEDRLQWLHRKLENSAELLECQVSGGEVLYFRKDRAGKPGKIALVTYSGVLHVIDPSRFRNLVENGVGAAKCFGCGLLSVARV